MSKVERSPEQDLNDLRARIEKMEKALASHDARLLIAESDIDSNSIAIMGVSAEVSEIRQ